jgi:hypothetical protein
MNQPDKTDKNYDRFWEIRSVFDILHDTYVKFYNSYEYVAVDRVTELFKGRVIFKPYIPKKHKRFSIKIYKLCNKTGWLHLQYEHTCGKGWQNSTQTMKVIHVKVQSLTTRVDGVGHKRYMENFFSPPELFDDLRIKAINCCGTVRQNHKGMAWNSDNKTFN